MVEEHREVVLADDNRAIRLVLRQMIETRTPFTVVGEAESSEEAIAVAEKTSPDLVVMDVNMPGRGGIFATGEIKSRWPHVKVLVFSTVVDEETRAALMEAGADAYIEKQRAWSEIIQTIVALGTKSGGTGPIRLPNDEHQDN